MNRNEIRTTLDDESIRLSKSLGQNLLHDQNVLKRIVKAGELTTEDKVLEIGPGLGALTEHLLPAVGQLTAIEMDRRLEERLIGRDDDVHIVAGEGVAGTRPGIGQIDNHQRRALAITDAALKSALLINIRISREYYFEGFLHFRARDRHCRLQFLL